MVLCRSGRSRAQPAAERPVQPREEGRGVQEPAPWPPRAPARAAAPSSRQQIAATAEAFSSVSAKAGEAACGALREEAPRGRAERPPRTAGERVEAGSARGATGYSCSPRTRNGARLVASTVRPGQDLDQVGDLGRRLQHVLEVVEHEQEPLAPQVARGAPPAASGPPPPSRPATGRRWARRGPDRPAGPGRRRPTPSGKSPRQPAGPPRARGGSCPPRRCP